MEIFLDSPKEDFEKLEFKKPSGYFNSFVIIPTGELHDSGYGCMKFALFNNEEYVGCVGGGSDVIHFNGIGGYGMNWSKLPEAVPPADFQMDLFPNGLFRVFRKNVIYSLIRLFVRILTFTHKTKENARDLWRKNVQNN